MFLQPCQSLRNSRGRPSGRCRAWGWEQLSSHLQPGRGAPPTVTVRAAPTGQQTPAAHGDLSEAGEGHNLRSPALQPPNPCAEDKGEWQTSIPLESPSGAGLGLRSAGRSRQSTLSPCAGGGQARRGRTGRRCPPPVLSPSRAHGRGAASLYQRPELHICTLACLTPTPPPLALHGRIHLPLLLLPEEHKPWLPGWVGMRRGAHPRAGPGVLLFPAPAGVIS